MNASTTQNKRAAIYVRVSTVNQADGYGLQDQLEETRRYADALGLEVVGEYSDTISGRKGEDEREGLDSAVAAGLNGDYEVLVVREVSRFARNARTALGIAERLTEAGVTVTDTKGNNSDNKLVFTILNAIAEYEADQIKERMVGGRKVAASQGRWPGGSPPFGYDIGDDKTLELNPDESPVVETVFKLALDTAKYPSSLSIAKELRKRKVPTRDRNYTDRDVNGVWGHTHIQSMLTDPIYKGDGRDVTIAGETFNIPAPAIVDADVWKQAQGIVEKRRKEYAVGGAAKRIYALGGRIIHDHGDGDVFTMRGEMKLRKATDDHPYDFKRRYYRCSAVREPNGSCPGTQVGDGPRRTTVIADDVESRVMLWGLNLIADPDLFAESVEDHRRAELAAESDAEVREVLEDQLKSIPVKRDRWIEQYGDGLIGKTKRDEKLAELDAEAERLTDELETLEAKLDPTAIMERLMTIEVGEDYKPTPGDFNPADAEWPQVANWLRSHVEAYHETGDPLPEIVHAWVAHFVDILDLRVIVHDRETIEANGGVVAQRVNGSTDDVMLWDSGTSKPNSGGKVSFSVTV